MLKLSDLTTRKRYTNTIDIKLLESLKELSQQTRIPESRLLDEAIHDLLKKYEAPTKSKPR
jgi:hypothetical protein